MSPVVSIETIADLRAHIGEEESFVHGRLTPFGIRRWHLVATVVAGAHIVGEFCAEHSRDRCVFDKDRVFAIGVIHGERGGSYVFSDPVGVSSHSVEG